MSNRKFTLNNFLQSSDFLSDKQIIKNSSLVFSGENIEIYSITSSGDFIKFSELCEISYLHLLELFDFQKNDIIKFSKIKIYISNKIQFSHVLGGYNHFKNPQPIIFLNERSFFGAIKEVNATYIHEMVHLFTWNYHSHTLREGLADYCALKLKPNTAIGPVPATQLVEIDQFREILKYLGTTKKPPRRLKIDSDFRRNYYLASRCFVKYIIDLIGIQKFMTIYDSAKPEILIENYLNHDLLKLQKSALINSIYHH
ncbi:MAG: hypothetical protein RLZZ535_1490 [Cyanobacteriota bacterium]|jgi:hypothetical protein